MKKILFVIGLFLISLVPKITGHVHADGAFFSNRQRHLYEPEQKAIVVWDGQSESMIISAKVKTEDVTDLSRIVWLIPLESSVQPEVKPGDISVFKTFVDYFAPEREFGTFGARVGVSVLEMKEIDIYDIAILRATDARDLVSWMNAHGFAFPEAAIPIIQGYVKKNSRYFVANRIDPENRPDLKLEDLANDLRQGIATPLRIDFRPSGPIYPLRISGINKGHSKIEVYFCSQYVAEDVNGILKIDDVKVLPHRIKKQVAPHLDLKDATYVTRLSYEGELSDLAADAAFRPSPEASIRADKLITEDEIAFEKIHLKAKVRDGYYILDNELLEKLRKYAGKYPASRFVDDAVMLLIVHVPAVFSATESGKSEEGGIELPISAETLEGLYNSIAEEEIHLEDFTQTEHPPLKVVVRYYTKRGVLREWLMMNLAMYYKYEGNRAASGKLAQQIYPSLSRFRETDEESLDEVFFLVEMVELLLPEHQLFEKYFDKASLALVEKDWAVAEQMLEKAISVKKEYRPCHIGGMCEKNLPAAYYLLGWSRTNMNELREGREAFERMIQIAPKYDGYLFLKDYTLTIQADRARVFIVGTYLEEGEIEKGLEEGLRVLRLLQEKRSPRKTLALAHYNLACAYALKTNTTDGLKHIKESLRMDPSLKKAMLMDKDLRILHEEKEFKDLIK